MSYQRVQQELMESQISKFLSVITANRNINKSHKETVVKAEKREKRTAEKTEHLTGTFAYKTNE